MNQDFASFLNGIAGLGLAATAAVLSGTIMKAELMPEQLKWLGAAGIVVATCVLVISFAFRSVVARPGIKGIVLCLLVVAISFVIYLRATRVEEISINGQSYSLMTGWRLSAFGQEAKARCLTDTKRSVTDYLSDYELVKCAGPDQIRALFRDYSAAGVVYVLSYLTLLACFTLLVSSVQLVPKQ